MKKNTVMRVLSLILVLTLMSTCAISSTFAKYVTRAQGEDVARVAKWGVLVSIEGDTFATTYAAEDEAYLEAGGTISVDGNGDKVVAPGTNSDQVGSTLVASVTGTPEVAVRYTLEGKNIKDVTMAPGEYTDYTILQHTENGYEYVKAGEIEKVYAPIKWNLTITKGETTLDVATALYDNLPAANLAQAEAYGLTREGCSIFDAITIIQKVAGNEGYTNIVEAALGQIVSGGRNFQLEADKDAGTFKLSYDFDPNKEMDFTFKLSWSWPFEYDTTGMDETEAALWSWSYDVLDTYIGNVASGAVEDSRVNTTIEATLTATAVQID